MTNYTVGLCLLKVVCMKVLQSGALNEMKDDQNWIYYIQKSRLLRKKKFRSFISFFQISIVISKMKVLRIKLLTQSRRHSSAIRNNCSGRSNPKKKRLIKNCLYNHDNTLNKPKKKNHEFQYKKSQNHYQLSCPTITYIHM